MYQKYLDNLNNGYCQNYLKLLEDNLPELKEKRDISVLNIGCGKCFEGKALREFFKGEIFGFDIDKEAIIEANKLNEENNIEFQVHDCRQLENIVKKEIDLVILRHPNFYETNWHKILNQTHKITSNNGLIFATFSCEFDYKPSIKAIKRAGYKIQISQENQYADFFPERGFGKIALNDGFIIKAKKSKISLTTKLLQTLK